MGERRAMPETNNVSNKWCSPTGGDTLSLPEVQYLVGAAGCEVEAIESERGPNHVYQTSLSSPIRLLPRTSAFTSVRCVTGPRRRRLNRATSPGSSGSTACPDRAPSASVRLRCARSPASRE